MVELIGAIAISTVTAWAAFAFTVVFLERLGLWRRMEIGAILPLVVCGFVAAIVCWVLTFWYVGPSIRIVTS